MINRNLILCVALAASLLLDGGVHAQQSTARGPDCDRDCMEGYAIGYALALIHHDASLLPLAPDAVMTVNQEITPVGTGLWKSAVKFYSTPSSTQYVVDFGSGQVGMMGIIDIGEPAIFATRLKIASGTITEIETLIKKRGDAGTPFWPQGYLYREAPYIRTIPEKIASPREQLAKIADTYWTSATGSHAAINYSADCMHLENGMNTSWERPLSSDEAADPKGNPASDYDGRIWTCARELERSTRSWQKAHLHRRLIDEERGLVMDWNLVDSDRSAAPRAVAAGMVPKPPSTPPKWGPPSPGVDGWPICDSPLCGNDKATGVLAGPGGLGGPGAASGSGGQGGMPSAMFGLTKSKVTNYNAQLFRIARGQVMREQVFWTVLPAGTRSQF